MCTYVCTCTYIVASAITACLLATHIPSPLLTMKYCRSGNSMHSGFYSVTKYHSMSDGKEIILPSTSAYTHALYMYSQSSNTKCNKQRTNTGASTIHVRAQFMHSHYFKVHVAFHPATFQVNDTSTKWYTSGAPQCYSELSTVEA